MLETTIRVTNSSDVGTTGLTDTNIKFRRSPFGSGDEITIAGVSGGTNGVYLCSFIGVPYQAAQLWIDGVYQATWGTKYIGDIYEEFLSKDDSSSQTMSGAIAMGSNKITGLALGTASGDAVPYQQAMKLNDTNPQTMSGQIDMNSIRIIRVGTAITTGDAMPYEQVNSLLQRAFISEANQIIVDSKRAADISGYIYNDLDSAVTYAASVASVNSRQNIYLVPHIGSYYTISQSIPDYVNLYGLGGIAIVRGAFSRSGSVALSSRMENIYFEAVDANHVIVRTIALNSYWQTVPDSGDGGTISTTSSHLTNCGLFGQYSDTGDDVTSGGTNKIINCHGNFNVTWQSSDEMYGFNAIVGDTFNY